MHLASKSWHRINCVFALGPKFVPQLCPIHSSRKCPKLIRPPLRGAHKRAVGRKKGAVIELGDANHDSTFIHEEVSGSQMWAWV